MSNYKPTETKITITLHTGKVIELTLAEYQELTSIINNPHNNNYVVPNYWPWYKPYPDHITITNSTN